MDAKFEVKTAYNKTVYLAFAKMMYRHQGKIAATILCAIGGAAAVYGIYGFAAVGYSKNYLLAAAVSIFAFAVHFAGYKISAQMMMGRAGVRRNPLRLDFMFDKDGITIRGKQGEDRQLYSAITEVVETKLFYFLFVTKQLCYIVPKPHFKKGSPEKFRAFIEKKTGKTAVYCKI